VGNRQEEYQFALLALKYVELPEEVIPSALMLGNNGKLLLTIINFI
jgi:hypothetical protein